MERNFRRTYYEQTICETTRHIKTYPISSTTWRFSSRKFLSNLVRQSRLFCCGWNCGRDIPSRSCTTAAQVQKPEFFCQITNVMWWIPKCNMRKKCSRNDNNQKNMHNTRILRRLPHPKDVRDWLMDLDRVSLGRVFFLFISTKHFLASAALGWGICALA